MLAHRGFELMAETECRDLLGFRSIGHIALSIGALPAIFPVNYVLDGDSIVFRTANGTQSADSTIRAVLAFETGYTDPSGRGGWSVLVVGMASEIVDRAVRMRLAADHPSGWSPAEADRLFRLPIDMISGTRILKAARTAA